MVRGFKDFFLRGNVVHLSVAVIIGTAFTATVTAVVNNWISPLVAAFGGRNPNGLAITLVSGNLRSVMDFGAIITAVLVFVIIAAVVYYLIVLPVKEMQLRRMWAARSRPPVPTELELLADIRGLLRQQQGLVVPPPPPPPPARGEPRQPVARAAEGGQRIIEVGENFSARLVALPPGDTPGLLIEYGGNQVAFAAGRELAAVANAHEFAVGLAYSALAFASRCRIQTSPRHAQPAARA